jgi:hypothetical protein
MIEQILHMTKTADGIYRIGVSVPAGVPLDYAEIQMLDIAGPHEMSMELRSSRRPTAKLG